jgi:hypothetical protein
MRRLLTVCVVLLTLASPAFAARRRPVEPGCAIGTLLASTYANVLAKDGEFVYIVDESALLTRVPRLGGSRQDLADVEGWFPLAMVVDDTTVYMTALPVAAIFTPLSGSLLAVPKNGGVLRVLASGVDTAFALTQDETHLYWAAAGIFDFNAGTISAGGKLERMKKDGSARQVLAPNLSAPVGLALDDTNVYFGESGFAQGDATVGLERVNKNGGNVTIINGDLAVLSVALDGSDVIVTTAGETEAAVVALARDGSTQPRTVMSVNATIGLGLQIADRRAYVMVEREESELQSASIDVIGPPVLVQGELDGDAFLLDGCAAVVNVFDGDIARILR